jgi:group I intron endonuclease
MQKHRISTNVGRDQKVVVELKNDFDLLEMQFSFNERLYVTSNNCVYAIKNIKNNKLYIGSTVNLKKRLIAHYNFLNKNKHINVKLQRSWNIHGEESFVIYLLEENINIEKIIEREQFYIDKYDTVKYGYNILPNAGTSLGQKWTKKQKNNYSNLKKSLELGESVIQYTIKGEKIGEFKNMKSAAKVLGLKNPPNIGMVCRGERKTFGGYVWEYKDRIKQKKYGFQNFTIKESVSCPHCNSCNTKKSGFQKDKNKKTQMYRCCDCLKRYNKKTLTPEAYNVDIKRNEKIVMLYEQGEKNIKKLSNIFSLTQITIKRILKTNGKT